MATEAADELELPEEVSESLETFHEALGKVEDVLKPLLETPVDDLREKMNPVESAKLDLVVAYSINSMFWMYLTTQGVDPREHPVKSELDRIKKYMGKVKDATEKREASLRINKEAAQRFVKSALWQPSDKEETTQSPEETSNKQDQEEPTQNTEETPSKKESTKKSEKRKSKAYANDKSSKKKKKKH